MNPVPASVRVRSLSFRYPRAEAFALDGIDLEIPAGDYLAVLGSNGSGKSTLLKLLAGLLEPSGGSVEVEGGPVALVAQNPDDQIVASTVGEDVAYGPESRGLPADEVRRRVRDALAAVGLSGAEDRPPRFLSGGERQRLAVAGALAAGSPLVVLDEACSMIDPAGRRALLDLLDGLCATVVAVTHSMEEAARARRAVVLHRGRVVFDGLPAELFARPELESWGLGLPEALKAERAFAARGLRSFGPRAGGRPFPLEPDAAAEAISDIAVGAAADAGEKHDPRGRANDSTFSGPSGPFSPQAAPEAESPGGAPALEFSSVTRGYLAGTAFAARGLADVSFSLPRGLSLAVVGATGSGKSTLLRCAAAILLPDAGTVRTLRMDTADPEVDLRALRFRAALAVQEPESALFERYVADDAAYGPRNRGLAGKELVAAVRGALEDSGLDYGSFRDRETRSLSGGEKRRAALAGVLAMDAELYLLDEPTAALDATSRDKVLSMVLGLASRGKTVVATTHSMEEAARFDLVAVMAGGELAAWGPPRAVFGPLWDPSWGLDRPWAARAASRLRERGVIPAGAHPLDAAELAACLAGEPLPAPPSAATARDAPPPGRSAIRSSVPAGRRRKRTGIEFFRNEAFGQFEERPSPLRRADSRLKAAFLAAAFVASLALNSAAFQAGLLAAVLFAGAAFGAASPRRLLRALPAALPYIVLTVAAQLLFAWPGDASPVLLRAGPIEVTRGELQRSLVLVLRIAALMAAFSLFFSTTPLARAAGAAGRFLAPLEGLGFPVRAATLAVGIAIRFLPILAEEAERIATAQLARGGGYAGKGRLRAALALTVPLFLRALERCEATATALELRGAGSAATKT